MAVPIPSLLEPISVSRPPLPDAVTKKTIGVAGTAETAAVEFEAFVLQSFIEAMLPRNAEGVFGTGTAGEIWKSMLAEQVARELARSGGVGIAPMIGPSIPEKT